MNRQDNGNTNNNKDGESYELSYEQEHGVYDEQTDAFLEQDSFPSNVPCIVPRDIPYISDVCSNEKQTSPTDYTSSTSSIEESADDVDEDVDVDVDEDGDTPLHIAIICNRTVEEIRELPTQYTNHQNDLRQTPLHLGVLTGNPDVVQFLIDRDADSTIQDKNLRTPAHIACQKGYSECLLILIRAPENGSNKSLGMCNSQGQTCLHISVQNGNVELVHILLDHGADINAPDRKSGRTALHFAVEAGNIDMIGFLLQYQSSRSGGGLRLDARTFAGETPLQLAYGRRNTRPDIADLLEPFYAATDRHNPYDDCEDEDTDEDDTGSQDLALQNHV